MLYRAGQQIGHYRLTHIVGEGPHAQVFVAEHLPSQAPVAIKMLRARLAQEEIEKFSRSARRIANLSHPHIMRVRDYGVERNVPYLVMEVALNGSLRRRHPEGTRLSTQRILAYARQISEALHYAHSENYLHQFIKPENMLLDKQGNVLLSDFFLPLGIFTARSPENSLYMAPEQYQGVARQTSDQYALGLIIYEWFTGERPTYDPLSTRLFQYGSLLPPLRAKVPSVSTEIEQVVMTALAREPHQRFKSMQAFASALEEAFRARPSSGPLRSFPQRVAVAPASQMTTPLSPLSTPNGVAVDVPEAPAEVKAAGRVIWTARANHGAVRSLSWSYDGRRLVSGGNDMQARVWDASTGKVLLSYGGHRTGVHTVAWSPRGLLIASAGYDPQVHVWSATRGAIMHTFQAHTQPVKALAWSSDGQRLASVDGPDGMVRVWDAMSGMQHATFKPQDKDVAALTWSPDGTCVAVASEDGGVQIWHVNTPRHHGRIFSDPSFASVQALAWAPGNSYMASGGEEQVIHYWNTNTGRDKLLFSGHTQKILSLSWSQDGKLLASSSADGSVRIWDVRTGACVFAYSSKHPPVHAVAWSPGGSLLACGDADGSIQVWQIQFPA